MKSELAASPQTGEELTDPRARRDHGGGLDHAIRRFGGARQQWIDLSTGINPVPYPLGALAAEDWAALPDHGAFSQLTAAARRFWGVPDGAAILPAPGASALIARIPALMKPGKVHITTPTYNEHAAAFSAHGWQVTESGKADARVVVHPNNPDGRWWTPADTDAPLSVIDESFCDVVPEATMIHLAERPGTIVLKSFGKFWGLAGLRLGFAIARPDTIARLNDMTGPWAVSGPALRIGARALDDLDWAKETRQRLTRDANRLDAVMTARGAALIGGTSLFRLYHVDNAAEWQERLARVQIWSRIFPYSDHFLRLGLPPANGWRQLESAL
ncbi:threonine-phosphate decarboxylase CobD [Ruegeria aquimaris]|uniref:threonine-phosphate decarboxylase n=1 Tax=Ruegeria aquimaris TaxID=2984333 RepID=A0ABT3AMP5_9RHOB|nr:threonine-phosphate decarboxylase CobD [Ruegeria sp. XHP0148]MCV2889381.1 threonine-phosphate decarboxylase CobD [Ruegeria sp. XHP0148]